MVDKTREAARELLVQIDRSARQVTVDRSQFDIDSEINDRLQNTVWILNQLMLEAVEAGLKIELDTTEIHAGLKLLTQVRISLSRTISKNKNGI